MNTGGVGLYCTVNCTELAIALATLCHSEKSEYVKCIVIIVTDSPYLINLRSNNTYIISNYYGKGFDISIENGGYDQIAARNFALDFLDGFSDVEWVMQHDADDLYSLECYSYIVNQCMKYDALAYSCFTFKKGKTLCYPTNKIQYLKDGGVLYNPHIRVWKKEFGLRYEKSIGIEKHFDNISRHCGVNFPDIMNIGFIDKAWHFHLHALLNKRHTHKIINYPLVNIKIPDDIYSFIKEKNSTI